MAQIVVVTSGKGGVGKTTTCALLGRALAKRGKKVLLLEMDSGLRGLDIILGVQDRTVYDIADVLLGRCEPIRAIVAAEENLHLLCAPYDSQFEPDQDDLARLTRGLSLYYDFLLIDTPAGLGQNVNVCIRVANRGLVVVTPDPVSMRDAARVADLMFSRGVDNLGLIINKVEHRQPQRQVVSDLDTVIDTVGVQLIGVVPDEGDLTKVLAGGVAPTQGMPAARAFLNIAARLCGEYTELLIM